MDHRAAMRERLDHAVYGRLRRRLQAAREQYDGHLRTYNAALATVAAIASLEGTSPERQTQRNPPELSAALRQDHGRPEATSEHNHPMSSEGHIENDSHVVPLDSPSRSSVSSDSEGADHPAPEPAPGDDSRENSIAHLKEKLCDLLDGSDPSSASSSQCSCSECLSSSDSRVSDAENTFKKCVEELRDAGLPAADSPGEYLSLGHPFLTGIAPKSGRRTVIRALIVSILAWMSAGLGLVLMWVYLSLSFSQSQNMPAIQTNFQTSDSLPLPIVRFCAPYANTPLFTGGEGGIFPLLAVASVRIPGPPETGLSEPILFPNYSESVSVDVVHLGTADASQCERFDNALDLDSIVVSSNPYFSPCLQCVDVTARNPDGERLWVSESNYDRSIEIDVATNELFEFCASDAFRDYTGVLTTFTSFISTRIGELFERGVLQDPAGVLTPEEKAVLSNKLQANHAAGFAEVITDFYCNVVFASGVFYPRQDGLTVGYDWDPALQFWTRRNGGEGVEFWNVTRCPEGVPEAQLNGRLCRRRDESALEIRRLDVHLWDPERDSETVSQRVMNSSFVFTLPVSVGENLDLRLRRRRELDSSVSLDGSVGVYDGRSLANLNTELYRYNKVKIRYDRMTTESLSVAATYDTGQYIIDMLNSLSLFTGFSLYTVAMGPILVFVRYHWVKVLKPFW